VIKCDCTSSNEQLSKSVLVETANAPLNLSKATFLPIFVIQQCANRLLRHKLGAKLSTQSLLLQLEGSFLCHTRVFGVRAESFFLGLPSGLLLASSPFGVNTESRGLEATGVPRRQAGYQQ